MPSNIVSGLRPELRARTPSSSKRETSVRQHGFGPWTALFRGKDLPLVTVLQAHGCSGGERVFACPPRTTIVLVAPEGHAIMATGRGGWRGVQATFTSEARCPSPGAEVFREGDVVPDVDLGSLDSKACRAIRGDPVGAVAGWCYLGPRKSGASVETWLSAAISDCFPTGHDRTYVVLACRSEMRLGKRGERFQAPCLRIAAHQMAPDTIEHR